jgi:hypothetical protein
MALKVISAPNLLNVAAASDALVAILNIDIGYYLDYLRNIGFYFCQGSGLLV